MFDWKGACRELGNYTSRHVTQQFFRGIEENFTSGVMVQLQTGPSLIFGTISNVLGDEAALKRIYDCKGAAGTRNCMLCLNVLKKGTVAELELDSEQFVEIDCLDQGRFQLATNANVWEAVDKLKAASSNQSKTAFAKTSQAYGFNHNPQGLLLDLELRRRLRPISTWTFDWAHIYLNHGIGGVGLANLISWLARHKLGYDGIRTFMGAGWEWPRHLSVSNRTAQQVFSDVRAQSSGWKSSASEFLQVAPVVLHFLETVVRRLSPPDMDKHIACFRQLCLAIDAIQATKLNRYSNYTRLGKYICEAFSSHVNTYGTEDVVPKHHMAMHLSAQYARDGMVLDTFPCERLHQIPKSFGNLARNTSNFEESVLVRTVAHQLNALAVLDERDGLVGQIVWYEPLHANLANKMLYKGLHVHAEDILLVDGSAFLVQACGYQADELFLVGTRGVLMNRICPSSAKWRFKDELHGIWLGGSVVLKPVHCWAECSEGVLVLETLV